MDSTFDEVKPQANQFRDRFQIIMNSIKALAKQLDAVEIKEDQVAQQLIPMINDAKNTILTAIRKETSDQLQEINSFDDVLALRDRAKGLLNRLGETGGSHSRTMHSFFGKHAKVLKLELGLLDKEMKKLNEFIDRYTKKTSSLAESKESIARIYSAMNAENESANKVKEAEQELESLKSKENDLVKRIEEFKNTDEFQVYKKSQEELQNARNNVNNLLSDVNTAFSRISRPLSKYTYEVGLSKENNYLMQSIMENVQNLMDDSRVNRVIEVLNKVREGVETRRITTKNPEKDVENIKGLIINLPDYIKQFQAGYSIVKELQEKNSVIHNKLENMRNELEQIRYEIQQKESYIDDYKRTIDHAKSTVKEELKKIMDRIEKATGNRIKITL